MKRKILLVSPTPSHPQTAGNRARVDALLTMIRSLGHDVYFLHIENEAGSPEMMREAWGDRYFSVGYKRPRSKFARIRRRLLGLLNEDARYTYSIDEWYDDSVDEAVKGLHEKYGFDTVIVEYVFFSRVLECFDDGVLKIIDTHDAFANRHRHYLEKGQRPKWFTTTAREEGRGFDRADVVIAIQDKEKEIFSRQTRARVITVGHMVPIVDGRAEARKRGQMLFVASDNAINVEGIKLFIENTLPEIRRALPEAELVMAGTVCRLVDDHPGIVKLGRVDDLQPLYERASLVINPVIFNTGLSIKNLEALGFSRPLLTAPVGAEGIEDGTGEAFLVAEEPRGFAREAVRVLSDEEYAERISQAARRYASSWNDSVIRQLENILGRV